MSFPTTAFLTEENIVATTSSQRFPLGTRGATQDGRIFRYAQAGEALVAYELVQGNAEFPPSTSTEGYFVSPYVAGSTMIQMAQDSTSGSSLVANYYKDGYLIVNSTDVSVRQSVPIHSHGLLSSGSATSPAVAAQYVYLKLPGLPKAATTDTGPAKLVANPYKYVITSSILANPGGVVLGVTPVAVTTLYYFWLQTWGPCLCQAYGGSATAIDITPAHPIFRSTATEGAVTRALGSTESSSTFGGWAPLAGKIGDLMTCAPVDTFFCVVNLKMAP
jgi:hypothetical protein